MKTKKQLEREQAVLYAVIMLALIAFFSAAIAIPLLLMN